jgi:hypothetical protein
MPVNFSSVPPCVFSQPLLCHIFHYTHFTVALGGNTWKPESEKMGSTDTGDYFPEGYNREDEVAFSEGMGGSQAMLGGGQKGPQLPGMENLGADAVVRGGLTVSDEIPAGMQFIPSSVPDGTVEFSVGSTSGTFVSVESLDSYVGRE